MLPMLPQTAPPALPTGTVTFLFTDIEDSTRLAQDFRGEWEAALAQHNATLRESIAANQGQVFETAGDGVCAAFATASSALCAAPAAALESAWEAGRELSLDAAAALALDPQSK